MSQSSFERRAVFASPEDVPSVVSAEEALAAVRALHPEADEDEIVADGVRCPVYARGEGRGLLLVHGLGHDAGDFSPLFAERPTGFRLVALDLPGFGLADKPERDYPLRLLVDAVLAAARRFDAPPVVVGSSLGGHVAMLAALAEPNAFAGLLLLAPGGLTRTPVPVQAVARCYYAASSICNRADAEIVKNARRIFAERSAAREAQAARKLAVHRSPLKRVFALPFARVVEDVFLHPVAERLSHIRAPVHIISGERDPIVSPVECRIAAERAGLPFHLMKGIAHLPMLEDPDAFARVVLPLAERMHGGRGR